MWTVLAILSSITLNAYGFPQLPEHGPVEAFATINNPKDPNGPVQGILRFSQEHPHAPVCVEGEVTGLEPNTKHGFHVHESGDILGSEGCDGAGAHFNPFHKHHGAPISPNRHEGDLGNIVADNNGVARVRIVDLGMTIFGSIDVSILNRAIVVHANEDDLGLGNSPLSLTTGNSGARIGCGVILKKI